MTQLTIELADGAANELRRQAGALGLTVAELIELLADQISDGGPGVYQLSDEQIGKVRASMEDPALSFPHEEVMEEIDRLLDGDK